jgi:hypothetical protein
MVAAPFVAVWLNNLTGNAIAFCAYNLVVREREGPCRTRGQPGRRSADAGAVVDRMSTRLERECDVAVFDSPSDTLDQSLTCDFTAGVLRFDGEVPDQRGRRYSSPSNTSRTRAGCV